MHKCVCACICVCVSMDVSVWACVCVYACICVGGCVHAETKREKDLDNKVVKHQDMSSSHFSFANLLRM